jgi:hypothetical protein
MRLGLAAEQERQESPLPNGVPRAKEIPYDYVARFALEGIAGKRHQDVINVSIEGAFVATAIAYGFLPKFGQAPAPIPFSPVPGTGVIPGPPVGPPVSNPLAPPTDVRSLMAEFAAIVVANGLSTKLTVDPDLMREQLADVITCVARRCCGIDFKYSIVDSATGRELQNHPIHNLAGLGNAEGDRPFRAFPKPITFLPRSTIRIEVEEVSQGALYAGAELQIVLHGYKALGVGG